jgi:hypothetical protein
MIVEETVFLEETRGIKEVSLFVAKSADLITIGDLSVLDALGRGYIPYIKYNTEVLQLYMISHQTALYNKDVKFIELFKILKYFTH